MPNFKIMMISCLVLSFLVCFSELNCAERKPLRRPEIIIPEPIPRKTLEQRLIGVRPDTGEKLYESDYQIEFIYNRETGKYIYSWISDYGENKGKRVSAEYEPPIYLDVIVKAEVIKMKEGYLYKYCLVNLNTSRQNLYWFVIWGNPEIYSVTSPDKGWSFGRILSYDKALSVRKIVGLDWADTLSGGRHGIKPGNSSNGFSFQSNWLPGIIECSAKGYTPIIKAPEEIPEEEHLWKVVEHYRKGVVGRTIGPVIPPEKFEGKECLNQIISYLPQCLEEGWIENREIKNRLEGKLKEIQNDLQNKNKVKIKISQFLKEIEAMYKGEKEITSEAYGLLKYNLEHLLESIEKN